MRISGTLALFAIAIGCGGGDDGPTGNGNPSGPVASVQITGGGDMVIGQERTLTAVLRNASNQTLTGRVVAWSVDPAGVLSLSSTAGAQITVEALDEGTATVTATSEEESDAETIDVETASATASVAAGAASWSPSSVTISAGGEVTWTNNSGLLHQLLFDAPPSGVENDTEFTNGEAHTYEFPSATGSPFGFRCNIHPGMNGTVTVVP